MTKVQNFSNLQKHCSCGIVPAPQAKPFSGCYLWGFS